MTLQIFLHFFHHKFVTSLQSTSLSSAASALSLRRIRDALLLQRRSMTARAVSPSVNPRQRRGTRIDADAPRSAAADALLHRIYSGTALRCISPFPLYPRTRCPGLTENGSALRTSSSTLSSASPVVAHLRRALCGSRAATPMRPRCAHTNGVTENSASPTRRHSIITATSSPSPHSSSRSDDTLP